MAEDMWIAQTPSADATGVRHLENPVVPRRTRRARPLASLELVSVGKGPSCKWDQSSLYFVRSLVLFSF